MTLKLFTWFCLALAVLAVAYEVFVGGSRDTEAVGLFTSTMIILTVGFDLVRRELAKLRSE